MHWSQKDPVAAWEHLEKTVFMEEDSNTVTELLSSLAKVDASYASAKITALVSLGDGEAEMGNIAMRALLAEPAAIADQRDPEVAAAASLQRIGNALSWLETLPVESDVRSVATAGLMGKWVELDAEAASQWLIDQPDSAGRINAIETMINSITAEDPESAVIWALELPQGDSQSMILGRAFSYWVAKDAQAAREFADTNFDQAQLDAITEREESESLGQ